MKCGAVIRGTITKKYGASITKRISEAKTLQAVIRI